MVMALNQTGVSNGNVRFQPTGIPQGNPPISLAGTLSGSQITQPKFKAGDPVYGGPVMQTMGNPNTAPTMSENGQNMYGIAVPQQQMAMSNQPMAAAQPQVATTQGGQYGQSGAENATNEYLNAGLGLLNDAGAAALGQYGGAESNTLNLLNQAGAASLDKLNAGTAGAMDVLGQTTAGARNDSMLGYLLGGKDIQDALNNVGNYIGQGTSALSSGRDSANASVQNAKNEANSFLNPYNQAGQKSVDLQAAYTGALGPEAQKSAFAAYTNSPGQAWLRQQGEESIMNQAAATGGVGGGDVLKELQKFGTGLASQDFQNQYDRLATLTNQGMNAGTNMGNFSMNAGNQISNNTMNAAQGQAQLAGQGASGAASLGSQKAGMSMNFGTNLSDLTSRYGSSAAQLLSGNGINQSNTITDLAKTGANVMQNAAGQKADIIANLGNNAFNAVNNAGTNIAGMRYNTGTNLANQIGNASNNMANLTNQQGGQLSDLLGSGAGNIANLLSGTGANAAQMQQQLMQLLSNLAVGQGSQLSGLNQQLGAANGAAAAATGQGLRNTLSQGIGAYALLSDRRLKTDITPMKEVKGVKFYSWRWSEISGMSGLGFGVMSDEIKKIIPSAVIRLLNGFDCVDYRQIEDYINVTA